MSIMSIRGPVTLRGEVSIRGAKNASLPLAIAAVMGSEPVSLLNAPTKHHDLIAEIEALRYLGCEIEVGDGIIKTNGKIDWPRRKCILGHGEC